MQLELADDCSTAEQVRQRAIASQRFRAASRVHVPAPKPIPPKPNGVLALAVWPDWVNEIAHGQFQPYIVKRQYPRIDDIIHFVAVHYQVNDSDILSIRRTAKIVRSRHVAAYLSKELTLRSLPEIGRKFGGRDHTTILHAVRKITGLIETDPVLAADCEQLAFQILDHMAKRNGEVVA